MQNHHDVFDLQLISLLSRLRTQALALTRNPSAASDLVQDAVPNALGARDSFTPGTSFPAWMHRILRNRLISATHKRRLVADLRLPVNGWRAGMDSAIAQSGRARLLHCTLEGYVPTLEAEAIMGQAERGEAGMRAVTAFCKRAADLDSPKRSGEPLRVPLALRQG
ncbi:sigma factor [Falsiroseomonas oryziterrae]|uniref:sigma factor n=1 Tax=Falsiroseomonas oryziterrae TaxID=2911368 RepID=UPI001F1EDE1E|nr:sigma factor [Roseomonas sp. NPKOSM-4]